MESDPARAESAALKQLEHLVRNLGDELSTFRKRAHVAESRVRTLEATLAQGGSELSVERLSALASENADLKARLDHASEKARQLAARVKFIRQQQSRAPTNHAVSPAEGQA